MNTNKQNKNEYTPDNNYGNGDILLDNSCDPDLNLFSKNIKNLDTTCLFSGKLHNVLDNSEIDWFSIFHLNIQSTKKNFENFKLFFIIFQVFLQCYMFFREMA